MLSNLPPVIGTMHGSPAAGGARGCDGDGVLQGNVRARCLLTNANRLGQMLRSVNGPRPDCWGDNERGCYRGGVHKGCADA